MNVQVTSRTVKVTPCPRCGAKALRIEHRVRPKPRASFSRNCRVRSAYARPFTWPYLVCGSCGTEGPAKQAPGD